jgi:hypothetical protein
MTEWRALNTVVDLRKSCMDLVVLADALIYGKHVDMPRARERLPVLIRRLQARALQALRTLEGEWRIRDEAYLLALAEEFWGNVLSQEAIAEAWEATVAEGHTRTLDLMRGLVARLNARI